MMIVLMSGHPDGIAPHSQGMEVAKSLGDGPVGIRISDRLAAERRFVVVGDAITGRDSNAVDSSGLYPGLSAWMSGPFDNLTVIRWVAE